MSTASSSVLKCDSKSKPASRRALSASEIARNVAHFETWSTHQGCEQVSYSDLPDELMADVAQVFDMTGRLPTSWVDKKSEDYKYLSRISTPEIRSFILDSYKSTPSLFSDTADHNATVGLYTEISVVYSAWTRMQRMRKSKEKWSEAEYVANVYNLLRSPALVESTQRVHCTLSLPQPIPRSTYSSSSLRILNAKTVVPDCAIFLPAANIRELSQSAGSPFKVIKNQTAVAKTGSPSRGTSFRYQSTPRAQLPDTPGFEFVSSVWEDKKPVHEMLEDAYRQNRMATAAAVRHLNSLHIKAPVIGLVWSNGTVRAHVDWCKSEEGNCPAILSAPYPSNKGDEHDGIFHEWQLHKPGDILQVYFLIKNIDDWTMGPFRGHVVSGVGDLLDHVVNKQQKYESWKRIGDLAPPLAPKLRKENTNISIATDHTASPPKKVVGRQLRSRT